MSALPQWPTPLLPVSTTDNHRSGDYYAQQAFNALALDAALARLRECVRYMRHKNGCTREFRPFSREIQCSCGLDELLADLLPPGEGR